MMNQNYSNSSSSKYSNYSNKFSNPVSQNKKNSDYKNSNFVTDSQTILDSDQYTTMNSFKNNNFSISSKTTIKNKENPNEPVRKLPKYSNVQKPSMIDLESNEYTRSQKFFSKSYERPEQKSNMRPKTKVHVGNYSPVVIFESSKSTGSEQEIKGSQYRFIRLIMDVKSRYSDLCLGK